MGKPESFKVGWYPPQKTGSSHLNFTCNVFGTTLAADRPPWSVSNHHDFRIKLTDFETWFLRVLKYLLSNLIIITIIIIIIIIITYRKIPKISPGACIFQRPFLRGLFLEGHIFGGAYLRKEICVSKLIGLAL